MVMNLYSKASCREKAATGVTIVCSQKWMHSSIFLIGIPVDIL